jgi:3-methyladenine DNA glycosylase/8-oxoguanine DNA glycosylase
MFFPLELDFVNNNNTRNGTPLMTITLLLKKKKKKKKNPYVLDHIFTIKCNLSFLFEFLKTLSLKRERIEIHFTAESQPWRSHPQKIQSSSECLNLT